MGGGPRSPNMGVAILTVVSCFMCSSIEAAFDFRPFQKIERCNYSILCGIFQVREARGVYAM